jgi:hypothetical protein
MKDQALGETLPMSAFRLGLSFTTINLSPFLFNPSMLKRIFKELADGLATGIWRPTPITTFPPEKIGAALRLDVTISSHWQDRDRLGGKSMTDSLARRLAALLPDRIKTLVGSLDKKTPSLPRMPPHSQPVLCALLGPGAACGSSVSCRQRVQPSIIRRRLKCTQGSHLDQGGYKKPWNQWGAPRNPANDFPSRQGKTRAGNPSDPASLPGVASICVTSASKNGRRKRVGIAIEEGRAKFDRNAGSGCLRLKVLQLGELDYFFADHFPSFDFRWLVERNLCSGNYRLCTQANSFLPSRFRYIDYVEWERNWLASEACAEQLRFWQRESQSPGIASIATARPSQGLGQSVTRERWRTRQLSTGLAERLRLFARRERLGLFPIMMSALGGAAPSLHWR